MWVEVTSWKENLIRGCLESEPTNVPNLHGGQVLKSGRETLLITFEGMPTGEQKEIPRAH
jgi:hypothetical protein